MRTTDGDQHTRIPTLSHMHTASPTHTHVYMSIFVRTLIDTVHSAAPNLNLVLTYNLIVTLKPFEDKMSSLWRFKVEIGPHKD